MQHGIPGRVPLPGYQPIQHVEVGDVGGVDPWVLPTRRGENGECSERPLQPDREDDLEQVGQHEHRDHHAEQRPPDGEEVDDPARPLRRGVPQRDADHDGEQHGRQGQLDGCREAVQKGAQHWLPGTRRGPEVTPEQGGGVGEVLLQQWLVEAVLLVEPGHRLRGGLVPEQAAGRVAGQGTDPEKEQHTEPEQHRDHQQQPPNDEPQHCPTLSPGCSDRLSTPVCALSPSKHMITG